MEYIRIMNLVKKYKQGETDIYALKDFCLSVNRGEFVVILGPSGSGKSTLLHILGGIDTPTSGEVMIDGYEVTSLSEEKKALYRRNTVGYIFQSFNLLPMLTVYENIEIPVLINKNKPDKNYIMNLMNRLLIKDLSDRYPSQISGGQMQRVAIARALINNPDIILADEPTGNLDSKTSDEVIKLLIENCRLYNKTLIMITHNEEIALLSDNVVRIKNGQRI